MTFPIRRAWGPAAALSACALSLGACASAEDAADNSPTFVNTEARGTADPLYGETTSATTASSSAAPAAERAPSDSTEPP
ncbi:MAG: hypothetical protein E6499_10850, partial [Corynebacterium sp.]|nr:hypothetical protein [Corynebacterium sp.]